MTIQINITKDVLKKSMYCGTSKCVGLVRYNCAFSVALRDIFPFAGVGSEYITLDCSGITTKEWVFNTPEVTKFIEYFDSLVETPEKRLEIKEQSFEIDIPDSVIEKIGLSEVEMILSESKTLQKA
jgi:hypothetical protein